MQAQGMWSAGEADDKQRFLADLRALRGTAALDWDELAARAHYPSDVLKEAQTGPSLPSLPILAAYVRACDGDVPEWEERWRRLGVESHADPGLPVRPAGASPAAVAGARAGVSVAPPEAYDPERIRAALRASRGRSDLDARGTASQAASSRAEPDMAGPDTAEPSVPEGPANWNARTSWDETMRWDADRSAETAIGVPLSADGSQSADVSLSTDGSLSTDARPGMGGPLSMDTPTGTGASANGNHYASRADEGPSDAAVIEMPDTDQADAIRRDPFSAEWLRDGEPRSRLDPEPGWQDRTGAEPPSDAPDDWFTPRDTTNRQQTWPAADPDPSEADTDTWFTPRERADGRQARPERDVEPPQELAGPTVTGFWTPSAEVQRPATPTVPELTIPRAAWPDTAETPASDPQGPTDQTTSVLARAAAAAPSLTMAGPAVPPGPVIPPSEPRSDRLYPVRLLVVIVVAALIGSILVLLLR